MDGNRKKYARLRLRMCFALFCLVLPVCLLAQTPASGEVTSADRLIAEEEFRRGVQAYYRGAFNDSLMVLEKALSYVPGNPLVLDWLGRAYFRTGSEAAAMRHWEAAAAAGHQAEILQSKIDTVREWRTLRTQGISGQRYVETGTIPAVQGKTVLFSQPSSVLPLADGSFWMAAYGSNELVRFDVNGMVTARVRGPLTGFDRPFDILLTSAGSILVSEAGADRISVLDSNGFYRSSFGEKGRGTGQFLGPQYMAEDSSGNIYVTDYGNNRVCVFSSDFTPLFSFGTKSADAPGFVSPSGIACLDGRVYVADSVPGAVYVFDSSGNYLSCLSPPGSFPGIESMHVTDGLLVCAVRNRVILLNPGTGAFSEAVNAGNAPARILAAVPDVNGNLIMADYEGNCVQIASGMRDLAGGLFVQIERVNADQFPLVTLDVRVEDRNRNPVTGLKERNFLLTEDKRPPASFSLTGAGFFETACDVTVLLDRSAGADGYLPAVRSALAEISAAMNGQGRLTVVSAGEVPVLEGAGNPGTAWWDEFVPSCAASSRWRFDLGLRLAVNGLVGAGPRRAVIYLSTGAVSADSFSRYGLDPLTAYLRNNGVIFSAVHLQQGALPDAFAYLADSTGGRSMYVYRPEGLGPYVRELSVSPNGMYSLSFESLRPADFGEAYLPVEIEVYLMNRSGRDETGYFSPLQ